MNFRAHSQPNDNFALNFAVKSDKFWKWFEIGVHRDTAQCYFVPNFSIFTNRRPAVLHSHMAFHSPGQRNRQTTVLSLTVFEWFVANAFTKTGIWFSLHMQAERVVNIQLSSCWPAFGRLAINSRLNYADGLCSLTMNKVKFSLALRLGLCIRQYVNHWFITSVIPVLPNWSEWVTLIVGNLLLHWLTVQQMHNISEKILSYRRWPAPEGFKRPGTRILFLWSPK